MKWPWQKKSAVPIRSVLIDSLDDPFTFCSLAGESVTPTKAFEFYRKNSSVATAVDIIADTFEQIKPIIQLPDGSILEKHPVLELLNNPNPYMEWSGFAARIARHFLLTEQTHFFGLGNVNISPLQIYPVKPTGVTSTSLHTSEYVYSYHIGSGVSRGRYTEKTSKYGIARYYDGNMKEIYRIAGFSSLPTEAIPDSPLQSAALETQQQIKGRAHNVKMIDNGGRLSMLIVFNDDSNLTDDEFKQRTEQINERYAGPENAGRIGVIEGAEIQEIKELGLSQKDMDYAELDQIAGRNIYSRYHIPLPLISNKASTFNNLATGIEMLYDMASLPLADKLFSGLTRFLMPRFGMKLGEAKITYNPDSLQPLKARKLKELQERRTANLETVNEIRESMPNRKPLPEGDTLYQNASLVPMGTDMMEPEERGVEDDT